MNNINNVEKTMLKFQQLAKDAQSNGDPVLVENYLQHADHYLRRFNELNAKTGSISNFKSDNSDLKKQIADKEDHNLLIKTILTQKFLNLFLFFQFQKLS